MSDGRRMYDENKEVYYRDVTLHLDELAAKFEDAGGVLTYVSEELREDPLLSVVQQDFIALTHDLFPDYSDGDDNRYTPDQLATYCGFYVGHLAGMEAGAYLLPAVQFRVQGTMDPEQRPMPDLDLLLTYTAREPLSHGLDAKLREIFANDPGLSQGYPYDDFRDAACFMIDTWVCAATGGQLIYDQLQRLEEVEGLGTWILPESED